MAQGSFFDAWLIAGRKTDAEKAPAAATAKSQPGRQSKPVVVVRRAGPAPRIKVKSAVGKGATTDLKITEV